MVDKFEVGKKYFFGIYKGQQQTVECIMVTPKGAGVMLNKDGEEFLVNNPKFYTEIKEPRSIKRWIVIHESLYDKGLICSHTCSSELEAEAVKKNKFDRYIKTVEFSWTEEL